MLSALDLIVIGVYLAGTVALGLWYGGRQRDAADYFTSGGGMKGAFRGLLVGLSIAATLFSGISFLAYPSIVFQYGLAVLVGLMSFPICWVLMRSVLIPRYLAASRIEPYRVIEDRFGVGVRTVAAIMFLLLRVGWMSALIYAPTTALIGAADLGVHWFWPMALTIGLASTLYSSISGIRGVIVTDALQFVVIFGALVLVVGIIFLRMPVPVAEAWAAMSDSDQPAVWRWSLDPSEPFTVWSVMFGFTVANLAAYGADQMSLQRYLACGDTRSASQSFLVNIVGVMVVITLLGAVGVGLAMWYAGQSTIPTTPDQLFPRFIAEQLPAGVTGLVFAAILAATMSSMTSGINTLSATLTFDLRARFGSPMTDQQQLRFARWTSLCIGVAATVLAGAVAHLGDIFDIAQTLLGVFLGPLLGCLVLSLYRFGLRPAAVAIGMVIGGVAGWAVAFSPAFSLWVAPAALAATLITAALGSWLWPIGTEQPADQKLGAAE